MKAIIMSYVMVMKPYAESQCSNFLEELFKLQELYLRIAARTKYARALLITNEQFLPIINEKITIMTQTNHI